jgi:hypothetical protein
MRNLWVVFFRLSIWFFYRQLQEGSLVKIIAWICHYQLPECSSYVNYVSLEQALDSSSLMSLSLEMHVFLTTLHLSRDSLENLKKTKSLNPWGFITHSR